MSSYAVALLLALVNISVAYAEVTHPFPNGRTLPGDRCHFGTTNCARSGYHLGVDLMGRAGSIVVSMCPGEVVHNNTQTSNISNSKVIIKHNCNGKAVYGIYGHIYSTLNPTASINAGEPVGTLKDDGNNSHLHMGVSRIYRATNWGYGTKNDVDNNFLDFREVLKYPPVSSNQNSGIFDGAGSLINPPQNCYGCDRDIAVLHPHSSVGSTVVFQWLHDRSECDFLDLTANRNVKVVIKVKSWSDHVTRRAFKTTLSRSPVSLKKEGKWTIFAITSTSPISDSIWITANCRKPNQTFHNGSTQSVPTDLVNITHGYYWSGTGSIISQANRSGYGVAYDVATTFGSKKSLTSFQWLSTDTCRKLEINDGSPAYHNAGVYIKVWNKREFHEICHSLPCNTKKPTGYYVIKIKSGANEFNGGTIGAYCK